jgi:hypothetical protein
MYSERKFNSCRAAERYAQQLPRDADHQTVLITGYAAFNGWQPYSVNSRVDGRWERPHQYPLDAATTGSE